MQKHMSNLLFRLMALEYGTRSKSVDPARLLREAGLRPGMHVLDFGCGPGRYAIPAAKIVGSEGRVYALDIHPLAWSMVQKMADKQRLRNLQLIRSDSDTGLDPLSIDVVLLYDVLHDVDDKPRVLKEVRRVLKPSGILSYKDHNLSGEPLVSLMQSNGFRNSDESSGLLSFETTP